MNSIKASLAIAILYCLGMQIAFAQDGGIQFQNSSWEEVTKEALRQDKAIFIDAYASYCAPCKMMEKEVFSDPSVSIYFNSKFISYKADLQTEEGKMIQFLYEITALPDLIFVDPKGNVITRRRGGTGIEKLMDTAVTASFLFKTKTYDNYVPYEPYRRSSRVAR